MSEELYDLAVAAFNEAWVETPVGMPPAKAREIGRRAEVRAVRDAVIEECAARLDDLAQKATAAGRDGGDFTSAAWAIRALKGDEK